MIGHFVVVGIVEVVVIIVGVVTLVVVVVVEVSAQTYITCFVAVQQNSGISALFTSSKPDHAVRDKHVSE